MTPFNQPITEIIRQRFSCRTYLNEPLDESQREGIQSFMDQLPAGPFGSRPRFVLAAASEDDRSSLRGLGTYGFIQGATAFVIGAAKMEGKWLEDFGCQMETIILYLTSLGLGTCWLGGSFTRSSFGRKIGLKDGEHIPSVTAFGEYADPARARRGLIRRVARGSGPPAVGAAVLRAGFRPPAELSERRRGPARAGDGAASAVRVQQTALAHRQGRGRLSLLPAADIRLS